MCTKWDAKTIAAVAALLAAISGGVELRVQVGLLVSKVDRVEAEQRAVREELHRAMMANNE